MTATLRTASLVCASKDARVNVIEAFTKLINFLRTEVPEVTKYLICVPLDDSAGIELHSLEELADLAVIETHKDAPALVDLLTLLKSDSILATPPIMKVTSVTSTKPINPIPSIASEPAVILAHFQYKPGTLDHALEGWADVVSYVTNHEAGTLGYTVSEDKEGSEVRTLEVYENWEYVSDVHLKSEAIGINQKHNGGDRTGLKGALRVKIIDGYFGRQ